MPLNHCDLPILDEIQHLTNKIIVPPIDLAPTPHTITITARQQPVHQPIQIIHQSDPHCARTHCATPHDRQNTHLTKHPTGTGMIQNSPKSTKSILRPTDPIPTKQLSINVRASTLNSSSHSQSTRTLTTAHGRNPLLNYCIMISSTKTPSLHHKRNLRIPPVTPPVDPLTCPNRIPFPIACFLILTPMH